MANGTDFDGSNAKYGPPSGVSEDQCKTLHVFKNGACIVSCWELDNAELAEVIRTRRVFSSIWSGQKLYPQFIGSESAVHAVVADFGAVWKMKPITIEPPGSLRDAETNPPGVSPICGINPYDDEPQPQSENRIPLEFAAREVLNRFRELESNGAHTKDREYAITLLSKALD